MHPCSFLSSKSRNWLLLIIDFFFNQNYPYLQFQSCLQVHFGELHKLENHSLTVTLLTNPAFRIFLFNSLPFPYSLHFILMLFFFQILLSHTTLIPSSLYNLISFELAPAVLTPCIKTPKVSQHSLKPHTHTKKKKVERRTISLPCLTDKNS